RISLLGYFESSHSPRCRESPHRYSDPRFAHVPRESLMRGHLRAFGLLALLALILGCGGGSKSGSDKAGSGPSVKLSGAGSTFIQPIMQTWTGKYEEASGRKTVVDYQGTGSGKGVSEMSEKTRDFGCSDAPMTKSQLDKAKGSGGEVVHVPLVAGAVVVAYNLK